MKYYFVSFTQRTSRIKKTLFGSKIIRSQDEVDNVIICDIHPIEWLNKYTKWCNKRNTMYRDTVFIHNLVSYSEISGEEYFKFQAMDLTLVKQMPEKP